MIMLMMTTIPDSLHRSTGLLPSLCLILKPKPLKGMYSFSPPLPPSQLAASLMLSFISQDEYPQVQMTKCHSIKMPCIL